MDTLPLELHAQIFEAACVDDGTTARSLSLVSRYIREVSKPFLYHSIVVSGLEALTTFTAKLDTLPPHLRRIRHLFLSDWTYKSSQERSVPSDDASMERYDQEEAVLLRIIEYAAPTLETLALSVFCPFNGAPLLGTVFAMTFPRLTNLAVHGFYPFPHAPNAMPRLQRLLLSGNRNPHGLLEVGGLSAACPALAHLEVAGLSSAVSFASELRAALLAKAETEDDLLGHANPLLPLSLTLPTTLRSLRIEYLPASPAKPKQARVAHEKMKMLLDVGDVRGMRYEVMERRMDDVYGYMRSEWLDEGGASVGSS